MWSPREYRLFRRAGRYIGRFQYQKALEVAEQLCNLVQADPVKHAYVLGCKKAVALRGMGRTAEADAAYHTASRAAVEAGAPAIAAYIMGDWSLMVHPTTALKITEGGCELLQATTTTPDPERRIEADILYLEAIYARHLVRSKQGEKGSRLLVRARHGLKTYARRKDLRYQDAYLAVLCWQREFDVRHTRKKYYIPWLLGMTLLIFWEMLRQKKAGAAIMLAFSPRCRRQLDRALRG